MTLPPNEVQLWFLNLQEVAESALTGYDVLLDGEERARRDRFVFERDRRAYTISHAFVRCVLSQYVDVSPRHWTFTANAYGRPEITSPELPQQLRFNLSHTRGAALIGVAWEREVGVDVEMVDRDASCVELADRYFAPAEVADLLRLPEARRRDAFFDYWTLKESYIKARGMGLAIPLDQFAFRCAVGAPITLTCDAALKDDGTTWQFVQWSPDDRFRAAAAVRRVSDETMRFNVRRFMPLGECGEPVALPTTATNTAS